MRDLKLNIGKNIGYLKTDIKNTKINKTIEIGDDILVDVNSDGELVGIELLTLLNNSVLNTKRIIYIPQTL